MQVLPTSENPYQPPAAQSEPPDPDQGASLADQVASTNPSLIVRVAAGFTAILGSMVALVGLQFAGIVAFIPYPMMLVGGGAIFVAAKLYQARAWAAIVAAGFGGLTMVGIGLGVLLALGAGVLSFLAVLTVLVAPATAILAILAVGPCLRATRARRRLWQELEQP